jgi:homoserine kinase
VKRQTVLVQVPGSTSNLGSGFDTLGLAVKLYNLVRVTRARGRGFKVVSPLPARDRAKVTTMLLTAAQSFFARTQQAAFGLEVFLSGDVPIGRGLGASATARLGVVAGLNELTQAGLGRAQLLDLVAALEGHPDNAAPAIFGGFTVAGRVDGSVRCLSFPVSPKLKWVTLIPRFEIRTEAARRLVPKSYSRADTIHSLNRAAMITAALASGQAAALRGLFDDRVHQPYRERLIPQLSRVIRAGERAGAVGGFLSGSGSAIMCLTLARVEQVQRALQRVWADSEVKILTADNEGFVIRND